MTAIIISLFKKRKESEEKRRKKNDCKTWVKAPAVPEWREAELETKRSIRFESSPDVVLCVGEEEEEELFCCCSQTNKGAQRVVWVVSEEKKFESQSVSGNNYS